jgi:hypothetical protein
MCFKEQDKYGNQYWKCGEKLHNTHGPALITANGKKRFFINGVEAKNEQEYNSKSWKRTVMETNAECLNKEVT